MKLDFPATGRNQVALRDALKPHVPEDGTLLEIAAGSGQHAAFLADAFPWLRWLPTDLEAEHRASVDAWCEGRPNVLAARALDASAADWPLEDIEDLTAILCINMIHISPWAATLGLVSGAGTRLPAGGKLVLYGPYCIDGTWNADSNRRFDENLRARNPEWGVRDLTDVTALCHDAGLSRDCVLEMPANNYTVVFSKA